jgi:hypothetical protein
MGIEWRKARVADLDVGLSFQPGVIGDAVLGRHRAMTVWKNLFGHPAFVARIVYDGSRPVGFGASVFVTPEFIRAEELNPQPGINSRLLAAIENGHPVLLNQPEIGVANAATGIDALFLSFVWWSTSNSEEFVEMVMASVQSCVSAHAGYRLRSATVECPTEVIDAMGRHSGDFRILGEFPEAGTTVMRIDKEGVSAVAASVSNLLFQYRAPELALRPGEQQLLEAALEGEVDRELAAKLSLSLTAVKKRWRTIFARVQERKAEIFAGAANDDDATRGSQKRHLVLSYVRQHPEELRPFAWK